MKAAVLALLGAVATVAAQSVNEGPFSLMYAASDGVPVYLYACHSGAAQSGLCAEGDDVSLPEGQHHKFYFDGTQSWIEEQQLTLGALWWNLPTQQVTVRLGLQLTLQYLSNAAVPIFSPGDGALRSFVFDSDNNLHLFARQNDELAVPHWSNPYDNADAYTRWYVCWTFVGNYFYKSLAWVTSGYPTNPTCERVNVFREFV
ncbi:hypothetical protein C8034_v006710 [Colletotrichum sidae]|uniref:DUF7907 domain-containing protein n=3 Tax=Colletotrichum orbiculare species complex TaxID=2707354 RepID=N4UYW0_COLOR|nr:hypothetical protein Cob_v008521 [Colletotrichum orbiculare MAFF 240422]TDZ71832.1 hypothetical protein CTRI78_v001788 [Colletotrichum trifolii]TDZ87607.1 hypothetical protein C8034_v006710 [Colletotrichum sidae]